MLNSIVIAKHISLLPFSPQQSEALKLGPLINELLQYHSSLTILIHQMTLKLRNQKKNQQDVVNVIKTEAAPVSFCQPQSDTNPGCGFPKFAEQSFLYTEESGQYTL